MKFGYDKLLQMEPYGVPKEAKQKALAERLIELTERHYNSCCEYRRILDVLGVDPQKIHDCEDIPFLPARLFKKVDMLSVPREGIVKTMTSSGTSGQQVSRIFLDKETAADQQKTLVKIVSSFTGSNRMPMLIIDSPAVLKDRNMFSARGAGILGFSIFGRDKMYALDESMELNVDGVKSFLEKHSGEKIFLFGFTFMIWRHFYKELLKLKKQGINVDLSHGILIHGGGWKKLELEAVSHREFCESLREVCGLRDIHDYYGMVEQTGCIYMQCEYGHLHASTYSDIIVRNPKDFTVAGVGERGLVQVLSAIPESYPGHSLLTEDEGELLGEDDCPCGRLGKYFKIHGRMAGAELRGCSDTYERR